jgi:hypothetical protein
VGRFILDSRISADRVLPNEPGLHITFFGCGARAALSVPMLVRPFVNITSVGLMARTKGRLLMNIDVWNRIVGTKNLRNN